MPPEVRTVTPDALVERDGYFWLQLDSPEPFDAKKFDELARRLRNPRHWDDNFSLKWIATGKKIIFFRVSDDFRTQGKIFSQQNPGTVHDAGFLEMIVRDGVLCRTLFGRSVEFCESGLVKEPDKNAWRYNILQRLNADTPSFTFAWDVEPV